MQCQICMVDSLVNLPYVPYASSNRHSENTAKRSVTVACQVAYRPDPKGAKSSSSKRSRTVNAFHHKVQDCMVSVVINLALKHPAISSLVF